MYKSAMHILPVCVNLVLFYNRIRPSRCYLNKERRLFCITEAHSCCGVFKKALALCKNAGLLQNLLPSAYPCNVE